MTVQFREMPPTDSGRHGAFYGKWTSQHEEFMSANQFPVVTLDGNWADCSFLEQFANTIRWLRLTNRDKSIDGVRHLTNLHTLIVGVEPKDHAPIMQLKCLLNLDMVSSAPGPLLSHPSIQKLALHGVKEIEIGRENPTLKDLKLDRVNLPSLELIESSVSLRSLDIYQAKLLTDLKHGSGLKQLEILRIESSKDLKSLDGIEEMRALRRVAIAKCAIERLPDLSTLQELELLQIGGGSINIEWDEIFCSRSIKEVLVNVPDRSADCDLIRASAERAGRTIQHCAISGGKVKCVVLQLQ